MATVPSEEEVLRAVERRMTRYKITADLSAPGAATVSWPSVLECRIHRSLEKRREEPGRAKGPRSANQRVADRPTYTDLHANPVTPPDDPATARRIDLVREGTLDETACDGCTDGRKDCDACKGRGGRDCPAWIECEVCEGGPDACWECDGTGTPRTRRPRASARPRPEGARPRAAQCKRCAAADVACPNCAGEWKWKCPACKGKGRITCGECKGARRLPHQPCGATGRLTVWTAGVITHTPATDELKPVYPPFSRLKSGRRLTAELNAAGDELPDFLDDVHRKRLARLLAEQDREVRRRVSLSYLPLARVESPADPRRVYYAFPAATGGIEVIDRFSRQRVSAFAWTAAAVVALAVVVAVTVLR
ncbi:hypothetical protein [Streptomyces sp. NPDC002328]|uniref:hypothetical protein n=1 Tax=Streptomyces sp. NPDC002328 TaxID=3364642 RepID=UPI0036B4DF7E